jgi:hypothetical protein
MLSFLKRTSVPQMPVEAAPVLPAPQPAAKRNRQQNIKVSDDCAAAFAAMAKALGLSKAALFEDLVAERLETLQRRGVKIEA